MTSERPTGRITIVTGAASGIGHATSVRLAKAGGRVLAADLDSAALDWTKELKSVEPFVADVSSEDDNHAMVAAALDRFGGLDAIVLNAGISTPGSLADLPLEQFDRGLAVNLRGVVLGLRAALPALRQSSAPAVVATASVSGLGGDPGMWAYNTAKGGVVNFVRSAAIELGSQGIRVNGVCPGPTRTGMTQGIEQIADLQEALRSHIPLGRWGEADEVAAVICFLASEDASFVNGVLIPVDGGVTANTGQFVPPPPV